ncbi:fructose-specific PTS transporter subunit EIIC [Staphylococcus simulans]|uniref:fructose-specific PTS transporter subunit EIIC n=1 Tax=Staphylococcus simulans TaxID=1286 RepID=UPI000D032C13|nr:fructose-specific PTS transporter subunit EIIC [Staphylococcus simulans]AVO01067.1 PTS fructose transporter subunit IIABC [Staphylococcus simulans]AVO04018.1 PTS fructose transporter subunit IIABC [Staphylococcus simulans]AWG17614.1 PTS fructose transporter subunit IIABC [Staphylococcus simulans]AWI00582.1 PTS fructose transporter subunit IIABC [Staphylococcus simulans]MCE5024147.1 fructose-specific PTS transporter subunit EIIC [Staphylococcus simulans]
MSYKILGVTGCPTGIAHTYMAAEAIEKAAEDKGIAVKVETHGQRGIENSFTQTEIDAADVIIIAADKNVNIERFAGKKVINVSVSKGIKNAEQLINQAISGEVKVYKGSEQKIISDSKLNQQDNNFWHQIYVHLMNGVSHMLPVVVAGGVMIAVSFMFGIYSADPKSSQYNVIAEQMNTIGGLAMGLMVPILTAYIAQSIADRPGLVIGFIVGMIANTNGTGFLGGIVGGFLAGGIILLLQRLLKKLPKSLDGLKAIFLLPVLGIFIAGFLMWYISAPMEFINKALMNFLSGFQHSNPIILGLIIGIMCAADMGGPINKAAYVTGTALLADGNYLFMAGVSAACIAPPLATGFAVLFGKKYYNGAEKSAGYVNFLLGSTHITEGAIPFAAKRPLTIIPILMVGSSIAAILTYLFKVKVPAPHGGFIVLPVVTHPILWVLAILIGSVIAGLIMALEERRYCKKNENSENKFGNTNSQNEKSELIDNNQVFLDENFNSKDQVLSFIAKKANELNISSDYNSVYEGFKERERQSSTGMENGIAIPHVSSEQILEPKLIIVHLNGGIDWPALDNKMTDFVISILVPKNNNDTHLSILSKLSRKLISVDYINKLKKATSEEEIVQIIKEAI